MARRLGAQTAKGRRRKSDWFPVLSGAFDPRDELSFNVGRFEATLERDAVMGEGWSETETHIECSPVIEYKYGMTPHLDFANLHFGASAGQTALKFIQRYGPLRRCHYLPTRRDDMGMLEEPLRFRTPTKEFWAEQQTFRRLVEIWSELSARGRGDADKAQELVDGMEKMLAAVRPGLDISETNNVVAGYAADILISLYLCLWLDIAGGQRVRKCANEFCRLFFRPSREGQVFHSLVCTRRQHQRNYVRAKRAKARRRKSKRR